MLDEERIKVMTQMASYEENEGKKNMAIGSYFRSDYIGMQILKSVICVTIAFALVIGIYLLYDFENFMENIYNIDLFQFAKSITLAYLILVGSYAALTYVIFSYKYNKAKNSLKKYYNHLKYLAVLNERKQK